MIFFDVNAASRSAKPSSATTWRNFTSFSRALSGRSSRSRTVPSRAATEHVVGGASRRTTPLSDDSDSEQVVIVGILDLDSDDVALTEVPSIAQVNLTVDLRRVSFGAAGGAISVD